MAPIPITIITGFLGSGKTTLILNLLPQLKAKNPDYKLALIKNEFGDLAVDSQLASSAAVSGVRELLNGCICCNLVGQLDVALEELRSTINPDRIVIETSGSAFPATLVFEINRLARETGGAYVLDGVLSAIDVENWKGYEDTSWTARNQARYTDLIVFNKWETCDELRFDEVLDRVGDLEVETPWVKSRKGWVEADLIFGIDGGLARDLTEEHTKREPSSHEKHDHGHQHDHQTEVEVLSVELTGGAKGAGVDAGKLLSLLKAAPKDEVYRIKSVLTVSGTARDSDQDDANPTPPHDSSRFILNWAFGRWTFTPVSDTTAEHESSDRIPLRMTIILARYAGGKWKKKIEEGGFLQLDGEGTGALAVNKIL
ncbi:cobW-domain-containing protein [Sodiomyces alkalinus F11]|uniref:CobW-domain-containing protein n=1 Tax=Sodiomyces alkalinus (strain CBS 110278 / VKM F-3762 / F11) TaxID=1314773 RepID=A0A3N2PXK1_SODAK|nr:cobW-domain-containing protein [Sodiomyces alkalinus F11]ROT39146.1 cobW-domain-containing protein [Sodiomyces alkalinus F11]